jgi:DNA-binding NtrC family response regulator
MSSNNESTLTDGANVVPDLGAKDSDHRPEPGPPKPRILIADDHQDTRISLQKLLEIALPISVDLAADGSEALEVLLERPYSILLADLKMPRVNGIQLIQEVQERGLPVTVIVTTGHGSIDAAVQAMRLGAYDFLTKPPNPEHLCLIVRRALRERELQDEVTVFRDTLHERYMFRNILSKSPRMHAIFELIGHVAQTPDRAAT